METNRAKITEKQRTTLIEFMKVNPNLLSCKFTSAFTFKNAQAKWEEITFLLNSIPGAKKNWKSWKKTWQDLRSRTKLKYSRNMSHSRGTGGGPYVEDVPSQCDKEIFEIIKPVCLEGHVEALKSNCVIYINDNENTVEEAEPQNTRECEDSVVPENNDRIRKITASTPRRAIPRRPKTRFKKTEIAVENYKNALNKK